MVELVAPRLRRRRRAAKVEAVVGLNTAKMITDVANGGTEVGTCCLGLTPAVEAC